MACTIECPELLEPEDAVVITTATTATLLWADAPDVLDYLVYVWEAADDEPEDEDYTAIVYSPTYVATGLLPDTEYTWKIVARKFCPTSQSILLRSSALTEVINHLGTTLKGDLEFYLDTEGEMPLAIDLNLNNSRITNLGEGGNFTLITKAQYEELL